MNDSFCHLLDGSKDVIPEVKDFFVAILPSMFDFFTEKSSVENVNTALQKWRFKPLSFHQILQILNAYQPTNSNYIFYCEELQDTCVIYTDDGVQWIELMPLATIFFRCRNVIALFDPTLE